MKKLQNKTTLITGTTSGIGKACAQYFAAEGSDLIIMARQQEKLMEIREKLIAEFGVRVFAVPCDVRDKASVTAAVAAIPEDMHNIDILINNAGLASGFDFIQDGSSADWDDMIDTNIKGLLYVSQAIIPFMQARRSGHIINLGSVAGHNVYPKGNVYCATKFAVNALSQGFRIDLLEYGIKVTSVDPGMVETNFSVIRFHGDAEKAKNVYKGFTPLTADDIADTILYAATRPATVNLDEIIITPVAQANSIFVSRK